MQLHEADAGSRNPYSLAWGITAGLWWLLYTFEEPHETGAAGFIQLVHTGICQHLREHLAYLILQDQVDAVAVQLRMAGQDLLCPCGVLLQGFGVLLGRHPGHQHICQIEQLLLQAAGKDCQTHDLDQADVLLFDVVELCVGMVDPQRVLRGGDVVAQDQIQLISAIRTRAMGVMVLWGSPSVSAKMKLASSV